MNDNLTKLLKGRKVRVMTDVKVAVILEIKSVEEECHTRDLEPATQENDWYPATDSWKTINVTFTSGYTKKYDSFNAIELVEE